MANPDEQSSQMEAKTEEIDYISAVFMGFLQPITDLCDCMLRLPCTEPNEVQAAPPENAYARSIIALTAFLFEGACGKARYIANLPSSCPACGQKNGGRPRTQFVNSVRSRWPTRSRKYSWCVTQSLTRTYGRPRSRGFRTIYDSQNCLLDCRVMVIRTSTRSLIQSHGPLAS